MATLKISDLSVGDWVQINGRLRKVSVTADTWDGKSDALVGYIRHEWPNGYKEVHYKPIEAVKPIPITAEILEKNGFTRRSGEFPIYEYTTLLGKMLRITVVSLNHPYSYIACRIEDTSKELHEFGRIPVSSSVDRSPIHIHDLQHALRLAGVDREINL